MDVHGCGCKEMRREGVEDTYAKGLPTQACPNQSEGRSPGRLDTARRRTKAHKKGKESPPARNVSTHRG